MNERPPSSLLESPFPDPWRRRWRRRLFEHPVFHLALFAATFVTTTLAGGLAFTESGGALGKGSFSDGLSFSIPLLVILGVHEMGHYLTCRRYGLAATLPYFLPSPFINLIGTFGALIRIKEPIREKRVLLDVGAAGPVAGFFAAIPFLLYGVAHPRRLSTPMEPGAVLFDYPLLVRLAQDWAGVGRYTSAMVHEHATFMAAWFGLLVTAMNLLPLGQLDGGHVLRAVAGRRQPLVSIAVLLLAAATALRGSAVWAIFGLFVTLLMGIAHPPVEDEHAPLDTGRLFLALFCLAIFLLCFSVTPIRMV